METISMFLVAKANLLTVGIAKKAWIFGQLPVRVLAVKSGAEAVRSLKTEKVDSVISKWDLPDMADGKFLRALKSVKPGIPIIEVVDAGDYSGEISARSLGVSAVVTGEAKEGYLLKVVSQLLNLETIVPARTIRAVEK